MLPSLDALQEFKVESGIFQAEYGRATSFFYSGASYTQGQFSLNTQLVF